MMVVMMVRVAVQDVDCIDNDDGHYVSSTNRGSDDDDSCANIVTIDVDDDNSSDDDQGRYTLDDKLQRLVLATCRCNLLHTEATCHGDRSHATCRLVCTDLYRDEDIDSSNDYTDGRDF